MRQKCPRCWAEEFGNVGAMCEECMYRRQGSGALALITVELAKTVAEYGFTEAHDDAQREGELLTAAALILCDVSGQDVTPTPDWMGSLLLESRETQSPVQRLVLAATFVVREINRRQRLERTAR